MVHLNKFRCGYILCIPESVESRVSISTSELFIRFRGKDDVNIEHRQLAIDEPASSIKIVYASSIN